MDAEPQREHRWLERLLGDWTYEVEAVMEPGGAPMTFKGTESVRSLGGLWVVCEGEGESPGAGPSRMIITLGFDPAKGRYVGTFIGSTMTHLWVYEGRLDASGNILTLEAEGPSFTGDGTMATYRDAIEILDEDRRELSSSHLGDDGHWHRFMTMRYRRVK